MIRIIQRKQTPKNRSTRKELINGTIGTRGHGVCRLTPEKELVNDAHIHFDVTSTRKMADDLSYEVSVDVNTAEELIALLQSEVQAIKDLRASAATGSQEPCVHCETPTHQVRNGVRCCVSCENRAAIEIITRARS